MGKISTRVTDQVEGGSLIAADGPVRCILKTARYVVDADYNKNNRQGDAPTLALTFMERDRQKERGYKGDVVHQSCGGVNKLIPCDEDDGCSLDSAPGSNATGLTKNCNASIWFNSLEGLDGYDLDTTEDVSVLEGLDLTIDRAKQPERTFRMNKPGDSERGPKTVVVAVKIHGEADDEDEDDEPAPKAKGKAKGKAKSKAGVDDIATEVLDALLDAGDEILVEALGKKAFRTINANASWKKQRAAILKQLVDEDYLESLDDYALDSGTLTRIE